MGARDPGADDGIARPPIDRDLEMAVDDVQDAPLVLVGEQREREADAVELHDPIPLGSVAPARELAARPRLAAGPIEA